MKDVIIIGGGLAGLINAILLNRAGLDVLLFEEKRYPFHRVCGEYISNEVVPFLKANQLFPDSLEPSNITQFHLTSVSGKNLKMHLDLGGFGVSRKSLDEWLALKAQYEGVQIIHKRVIDSTLDKDQFIVEDKENKRYKANLVIGSFGKRSSLDKSLNRTFINRRSPYVGVKYHIKTDALTKNTIGLHNFKDGYCGVSAVENNTFNLCYLSHRSNLRASGSIEEMENRIVKRNPFLHELFSNSDFLFEKPEVINEISFEKKEPVYNHILMTGDSAGMITPLCGNGMAMAIHSSKTLSELIIKSNNVGFNRQKLEQSYESEWNHLFAARLRSGRTIQKLFGSPVLSELAVVAGKAIPSFASFLMKKTHGQPFN